jgi:diguanylate cyclase (GGDEF)-like protein
MNLEDAIKSLQGAVADVVRVAVSDDKTPLGNAIALRQFKSLVGTGGNNPDVVIFGDLNRFKSLNDQFGHAVGDAAISYVGDLLHQIATQFEAKAFRLSGDEFVVLMSSSAVEAFEKQVSSFGLCQFTLDERKYRTAMSFGIALGQGEVDFDELLSRAETACHLAKSKGDGRSVRWSEDIERAAMDRLREHCQSCGCTIDCTVPRQKKSRKLVVCPLCEKPLV